MLGVNAYYTSTNDEVANPTIATTKSAKTYLDGNLGYMFSDGLYMGALYFSDSIDTGGAYTPSITGYGASLGWIFSSGFFILGHGILDSTYEKQSSAIDKWTKGTGMQADLGYIMPISSSFLVGAQITYRSVKFTSYNNGTAEFTTYTYTKSETFPQLRFTLMF